MTTPASFLKNGITITSDGVHTTVTTASGERIPCTAVRWSHKPGKGFTRAVLIVPVAAIEVTIPGGAVEMGAAEP